MDNFQVTECEPHWMGAKKELLEEPMRWVGMYIAVASAACVLAMAADLFNGFRTKRMWFPCKYFSLNAFSLTLLAVAMKLPVDLTSDMSAPCDWFAKLSSLIFMSTALGNFMPSLGSMNDRETLANVTALGIFLVTVTANVCIQIFQLKKFKFPDRFGLPPIPSAAPVLDHVLQAVPFVASIIILVLLLAFVSLALMVLTTKTLMDSEYQEMHKVANLSNEEKETLKRDAAANEIGDDIAKLWRVLKIYWVMVETGSPQFLVARSVVCTASSAICLLAALGFAVLFIYVFIHYGIEELFRSTSMYGWSTRWILSIQTIGVVVGSVAPTFRYLFSFINQCSDILHGKHWKTWFHIEKFWIQRLVEWRDRTSDIHIRHLTCRKYLHHTKKIVLNLLIGVQILIVGTSKLIVLVSATLVSSFFYRIACIFKRLTNYKEHPSNLTDLSSYVLLLEGEAKLTHGTLENICKQANRVIQKGKRHQLQNLFSFLHDKFGNFSGVREFDSNVRIPSLHSQEPPYCWALPIVTLASIAIALPNIPKHKRKQLVRSLSEGLPLVKLIDMFIDTNRDLSCIRRSADLAWTGVALYSRWLDNNLAVNDTSLKGKDILQELSDKAETIIVNFKKDAKQSPMENNPRRWPYEVIAANAMYRICRTILLAWEGEEGQCTTVDDEVLFERLSVMIADIMAACLTNLERVITSRCHQNAIEEGEKNVHEALVLMGKTEKILKLLQQKERPLMDTNKAMYIEEWRALIHQHC